ncbi:MAG: hypothetical protein RL459_1910 [Pseudomonadota bacterium]|jgi:hypothetical protein
MSNIEIQLIHGHGAGPQTAGALGTGKPSVDVAAQRMRILRCTALSMAGSPGGLRFKAGSRPWLEGLVCESGKRRQRSKS